MSLIISDASGDANYGAAAAIYSDGEGLWKVVGLLAPEQPEILEFWGGIVGLLAHHAVKSEVSNTRLAWHVDNRSTRELLQRNPSHGLCRLFSRLSPTTLPQAPAQEAKSFHDSCHRASRWIREEGEHLLNTYGEGPLGLVASNKWILLDLRPLQRSITN